MKKLSEKNAKIIFIAVCSVIIAVCLILIIAYGVNLRLEYDKSISANNTAHESDDIGVTTDTDDTTYANVDTETTGCIETTISPSLDIDIEKKREIIEKHSQLIENYIKSSRPTYKKASDIEDDENADGAEAVAYYPEIAYSYYDIDNGYELSYNGDRVFYSASIIKEPYILYILREIDKKKLDESFKIDGSIYDLENLFVYTEDKFVKGSGIIQKSEFGTVYSYEDLVRLAITNSDNVAFNQLRKTFGREGFYDYMSSIGVESPRSKFYSLSAKEATRCMLESYSYFDSGNENALKLKEWMQKTTHRVMIPTALAPIPVASKYGWDLEAYHDMTIVFDEHPFTLSILTELEDGSSYDNKFIRNIAKMIYEMHKELYAE